MVITSISNTVPIVSIHSKLIFFPQAYHSYNFPCTDKKIQKFIPIEKKNVSERDEIPAKPLFIDLSLQLCIYIHARHCPQNREISKSGRRIEKTMAHNPC